MKIKTKNVPYRDVVAMPRPAHRRPSASCPVLRTAARMAAIPSLMSTHVKVIRDKATEPKEPCLILMNHSCFLDLKIAMKLTYPRRMAIVCTEDGMVGKSRLMRGLGCLPTQKFITDMTLIRDMKFALEERRSHVLLFPEAGYSFDGRATSLQPDSVAGLCKLLGVPVMLAITRGAFARDPLYNGLQLRRTRVTVEYQCLFTKEQVKTMDTAALSEAIARAFSFDQFAWQYETGLRIDEPFRADGLHRILYKCPACRAEGEMEGKGTHLTCHACGKSWYMTDLGRLEATEGETEFPHIPDWYDWERAAVCAELDDHTYRLDTPVRIGMMVDEKALYMVGDGRLVHDETGFTLTGCDGELTYTQKPRTSHSLNADFFWYEIGDVIGIGDRDARYYCFPQPVDGKIPPVAKARLATEELYRREMEKRRGN